MRVSANMFNTNGGQGYYLISDIYIYIYIYIIFVGHMFIFGAIDAPVSDFW